MPKLSDLSNSALVKLAGAAAAAVAPALPALAAVADPVKPAVFVVYGRSAPVVWIPDEILKAMCESMRIGRFHLLADHPVERVERLWIGDEEVEPA